MKSENNLDPNLLRDGYHRKGGRLSLSTIFPDIMIQRYIKAAKIMGYSRTYSDGRNPFGVTVMQTTTKYGVRQSSAVAFLESNIKENLHTFGYSSVTKILFDDQKRAIGVTFSRNGTNHNVFARKEVIISAGVIGSPQLLMLSGIGPKEHLEELNISVISDLRVGDNLVYSTLVDIDYDIKNQSEIVEPIFNLENKYDYYVRHSGPLAYKASAVHCFKEIPYKNFSQLSHGFLLPRIGALNKDLDKLVLNLELKNEWKDYYRPYVGRASFALYSGIRRSKSNGTIRLASNNPFDYPVIDPCILCDNSDVDDLVETIKLGLAIYESPYFKQFVEIYKDPIPGCNPCPDNRFCDSYLRCVVRTKTSYISPVGGCRIGPNLDDKAVVDQSLKVKGVTGLRVIDSSIIPIATEQANALAIMVGERGAQFIKEDNY
jgi:choline dehydrogenase-like flavoprotein